MGESQYALNRYPQDLLTELRLHYLLYNVLSRYSDCNSCIELCRNGDPKSAAIDTDTDGNGHGSALHDDLLPRVRNYLVHTTDVEFFSKLAKLLKYHGNVLIVEQ